MLRVDLARWGQTPADLRRLAMSAPHPRTRERFLALYEIIRRAAPRALPGAHRHPQTVMEWLHLYNTGGPEALTYQRTGGRPPLPGVEAGLGETVRAAQRSAAAPPVAGADPAPRWTLRRLVGWVRERFGRTCCRETIRAALHRLGLSWKKAKKLLGRADPERRQAFVEQIQDLLAGAQRDRHLLVYLDEAHIHQDADLGYGWAERGRRLWVASPSPRLSDKLSFYGLYLYNEGEVRLWPYARANGEHTIDVLRRLRAEWPEDKLVVVWDGASYHRAGMVREAATGSTSTRAVARLQPRLHAGRGTLALAPRGCHLSSLPSHRRGSQPTVAAFETRLNHDACAVADRLWVKDHLDPDEEKLRFSK